MVVLRGPTAVPTPPPIIGAVWIKNSGDPSRPHFWHVHDANTGQPFDDVLAMQITVEVNCFTVVDLKRMNRSGTERYQLVAPPRGGYVTTPLPATGGVVRPTPQHQTVRDQWAPIADAAQKLHDRAKKCTECFGTGVYSSPITGNQSPCSRGCKHP